METSPWCSSWLLEGVGSGCAEGFKSYVTAEHCWRKLRRFSCHSYLNPCRIYYFIVDTVRGLKVRKLWWFAGCILFYWALSSFNCNIEQIYWPRESTECRDKQFTMIKTRPNQTLTIEHLNLSLFLKLAFGNWTSIIIC